MTCRSDMDMNSKLWIARDEDGSLFLYRLKPRLHSNDKKFVVSDDAPTIAGEFLVIDDELFPELTFENSPQLVEVKLANGVDVLITPTGFDDFWNLYDKRVGKQKCIKLWGRMTLAEQKACMEYIPLYKQAQPDKQYRKNPETFLRNKSWNDEIIVGNHKDAERSHRLAESASLVAKYTGGGGQDKG